MPRFLANLGQDPQLTLINAQLRLQPQPDGSMKGYLGGYQRWRHMMSGFASGYSEGLFGYQTPAIYYALERNADGLRNPQTGEYDGISMAFEIDTVPAFITPRADQAANASTDVSNSK
jgi:hypothetical protein